MCSALKLNSTNLIIKQRDLAIDYLRSIAILAMIVLHINLYFPKMWFSGWFVNMAQWVVPAFIFCSLSVSSTKHIDTVNSYFVFVFKRLKRLLIPYYVWLAAYMLLMVVIGHKTLALQQIIPNIFLYGGIDFSWLVILFIYVTLIQPIFQKLIDKSTLYALILMGISALVSILYLQNRSYLWSAYRLYMFPSWAGITMGLMLMLSWIKSSQWWKVLSLSIISFIVFVAVFSYFKLSVVSLSTFNHKYPPDIYYFSYCLWTTPLAYVVVKMLAKLVPPKQLFSKILTYVSIHSYEIFFVHLCVLYALDKGFPQRPFNYVLFSALTFIPTIIVVQMLHLASSRMQSAKS